MAGDVEGKEEESTVAVPLRHNRNFTLLWIGQVLSSLGSHIGALAYPLLVLSLTNSAVIAGLVGTVTQIASFIVRLPAGSLSDRLNRKRTMVVCDLVRAVVLAALAVGVASDAVSWEVVMLAAIVDSVGDTLFGPASTAVLPGIVPSAQLESAWAATEARQYAAGLIGPTLGGILYGIARALPVAADAVSYGVSALTSGMLRGDFDAVDEPSGRKGLWAAAFDGLGHIWRVPLLRAVIMIAPLLNFVFSGIFYVMTLSLRGAGYSATSIGLVQSVIMAGGLIGAILATRWVGTLTIWQHVLLICFGGTIALAVAATLMPTPWAAFPVAVPFLIAPAANAALFAAMFRRTPEELRGRVNNSLIQVATMLATFAPFVAGLLVARTTPQLSLGFFAACLGLSSVLLVTIPGPRNALRAEAAASP